MEANPLFIQCANDAIRELNPNFVPLTEEKTDISKFSEMIGPAKEKATELLNQFAQGNKKPLAEMLGNAIKSVNFEMNGKNQMDSEHFIPTMHMCFSIMNMMKRTDPELIKNSGLSERDIQTFNGVHSMSLIKRIGKTSEDHLVTSALNGTEISNDTKEGFLLDVLSERIISSLEKSNFEEARESSIYKNLTSEADKQQFLANRKISPTLEVLNSKGFNKFRTAFRNEIKNQPEFAELKNLTGKELVDKLKHEFSAENNKLFETVKQKMPSMVKDGLDFAQKQQELLQDVPQKLEVNKGVENEGPDMGKSENQGPSVGN